MTTVAVSSLPQGTSVTLRNVTKSFGTTKVLNGLDLNIHSGELVALLGPSGCGKSTLLRIIAGFEAADQGSVLLDDVDVSGVPTNRRDIGLVFQAYSLFPPFERGRKRHVWAQHTTCGQDRGEKQRR